MIAVMANLHGIARRRSSWSAALFTLAALTGGCGQTSPTAPAVQTAVNLTSVPAPAPTGPATLSGQVTESVPTSLTGIAGAVVSVADGVNAGKSTTTDDFGFFTLAGLHPGPATVTVTADGYVGASTAVNLAGDMTSNFHLMPVPKTVTHTLTGDIAAGDGTCSDGLADYACRIVVIPIHNSGAVDATLSWTGSGVKLAVTLFQTGVAEPIARSTSSALNQEHIDAVLQGGADYEFRITVASGTGSTIYTLRVAHMN